MRRFSLTGIAPDQSCNFIDIYYVISLFYDVLPWMVLARRGHNDANGNGRCRLQVRTHLHLLDVAGEINVSNSKPATDPKKR
jgi:hypothetical protein